MSNASHARKSPLKVLDASFLLGAACTIGFYAVMLSPAMKGGMLHKYTTEHVVDYVIVALFFWGLMDVLVKLCSFPRDALALRQTLLPEIEGARMRVGRRRCSPTWRVCRHGCGARAWAGGS